MKIVGAISVDLDREQQSNVVIEVLADDYYHLSLAVQELKALELTQGLEQFQRDDLENHLTDMRHIDGVLIQHMSTERYDNWCRAWKKFRKMYEG